MSTVLFPNIHPITPLIRTTINLRNVPLFHYIVPYHSLLFHCFTVPPYSIIPVAISHCFPVRYIIPSGHCFTVSLFHHTVSYHSATVPFFHHIMLITLKATVQQQYDHTTQLRFHCFTTLYYTPRSLFHHAISYHSATIPRFNYTIISLYHYRYHLVIVPLFQHTISYHSDAVPLFHCSTTLYYTTWTLYHSVPLLKCIETYHPANGLQYYITPLSHSRNILSIFSTRQLFHWYTAQ